MKAQQAPRIDKRRTPQFSAELQERARTWIPGWSFADVEGDFGRALLEIAARFDSEVTERLDNAGEKMRRGFLDWLAVRGEAARPARMPVVFKLVDAARQAVLATAPVRLQADAAGAPVVFETEKDVRVVPGRLDVVVGVDAAQDAFYLPPPGLSDLKPLEQLPVQWRLKTFAAAGATKLQLDPQAGLVVDMIIEAGGRQYRITNVDNGIVTIEPPLDAELPDAVVRKVVTFAPFDGITRNRQEHALYLGHMDLLNIEAAATIDVIGASVLQTGIKWQYWGKVEGSDEEEPDWQTLEVAETQKNDALVLTKKKGAVEPKKIGDINSRWIRAYSTKVETSEALLRVDALQLRINCAASFPGCPNASGKTVESPAAVAMANTTPLVIDNVFFPLGKEPRQFDAFYLGSEEAFSKKNAEVQLCFKMAQPSFAVLSYLRAGAQPTEFLAGVAADSYLHLLQFDSTSGSLTPFPNREPLRPPTPGPAGVPVEGPPVSLDPEPPFRTPIFSLGSVNHVAVTASRAVWIWKEDTGTPANSGWEAAGEIDPVNDPAAKITALVYLDDPPAGRLFALLESTLFVRNLNDPSAIWEIVETKTPGNNPVLLNTIAPILIEGADLRGGSLAEGLVGVDSNNKLYGIRLQNTPLEAICIELLDDVAPDLTPAAVRSSRLGGQMVAVAIGEDQPNRKIRAFLSDPLTFGEADNFEADLNAIEILGKSMDVNLTGGHLTFVTAFKTNPETSALAAWSPFDLDPDATLFVTEFPGYVDKPAGAPTLLPQHVMVPTVSSQVLVAPFDVGARDPLQTALGTALITSQATDQLTTGDQVAIPVDTVVPTHGLRTVGAAVEHRGEKLYEFNVESIDGDVFVYRTTAPVFTGTVDPTDLDTLEIDNLDAVTTDDTVLFITTDQSTSLYYVLMFDPATKIAILDRDLDVVDPTAPPPTVTYQVPETTNAQLLPLMDLDPQTNGAWSAALLDRTQLVFRGADPELQFATAFSTDSSGHPELVVLRSHWSVAPPDAGGGLVEFIVDGSVGEWVSQLGNTFTNPELSWEYWNGKGWWRLDVTLENTQHLKTTGALRFKVPDDIGSSDWAGQTNFWIRARLIGGDYGREKVIVKTKTNLDGSTEQTVDRSTEGIRPPSVLKLEISYRVCEPILPESVLAQDSGSIIDQSDANRTGGAIVEAFVPLSLMLSRLSAGVASTAAKPKCPPKCECQKHESSSSDAPASSTPATGALVSPQPPRSLFIGLDATVSEAPVNVLLLVDAEHNHTAFAPMTVEALVGGSFKPIVVDDATRALGESGVLSMSFALPPTLSDLFGRTRTWLRLIPKAAEDDWIPSLRGAYLNAVFASATETLTRELLGSSDGSPNLTLRLARPPVLRDTLELRVREPLGEEERDALVKTDANLVLTNPDELPGDWVLWRKVLDPDDEGPTERVYALDEENGEIRFGDGIHGRIPPIGLNSVVAFRYSRTEIGSGASSTVPGNLITARTPLNLVSPVESVEAVFAADQAAGGAPPERDERVLRFGFARLRHRGRVVTANDIEDLALQSSPDIAQARAVMKQGYVRLVVVMKGKSPTPNTAQVRELRRLLLEVGPVSLSAPKALQIEGPGIRKLRMELSLQIETLDHAGQVSKWVKDQLASFFDSTIGGIDKDGWPLGLSPTEEDIAFVLINAPRLDGIADVDLFEIKDGVEAPWPETIKPTDIVMLDEDPVRIQFATAEVMA